MKSKDKSVKAKFGTVEFLEQIIEILLKQTTSTEAVPKVTDNYRLTLGGFLLQQIPDDLKAMVLVAKNNMGNQIYPLLRAFIEQLITFYYLQGCNDDEIQNFWNYSIQKTYRKFGNEITINNKHFKLAHSDVSKDVLLNNPIMKAAVEKFTGPKSGRPKTRWSNTSIDTKLATIDAAEVIDIRLLMMVLSNYYDDASEVLHGTLYGSTILDGLFDPTVDVDLDNKENWIKKHRERYHENITALFFLVAELLIQLNEYLAKEIKIQALKEDCKNDNKRIKALFLDMYNENTREKTASRWIAGFSNRG